MCFPNPEAERIHGEMGFDSFLLKTTLEEFVEEIAEESSELIVERPRFAYAIIVVADEMSGEICQASCVRQLDVDVRESVTVTDPFMDEEIVRALRELEESRQMLENAEKREGDENSSMDVLGTNMTEELLSDIDSTRGVVRNAKIRFPSQERTKTTF